MNVPFWIRLPKSPETPGCLVEASNISATGLYFVTDLPLQIGTPVDLSIQMPKVVIGERAREWCCRGAVVRVEPGESLNGKPGFGVKFQYYEVLKQGILDALLKRAVPDGVGPTERRAARRFEIAVPIMGWGPAAKCFDGCTRDVSTNGVYLNVNHVVKPSQSFLFLMRFPGLFQGQQNALVWAHCKAVRVEPKSDDARACVGIAARVEEYTFPPHMPARMFDAISRAMPAGDTPSARSDAA